MANIAILAIMKKKRMKPSITHKLYKVQKWQTPFSKAYDIINTKKRFPAQVQMNSPGGEVVTTAQNFV